MLGMLLQPLWPVWLIATSLKIESKYMISFTYFILSFVIGESLLNPLGFQLRAHFPVACENHFSQIFEAYSSQRSPFISNSHEVGTEAWDFHLLLQVLRDGIWQEQDAAILVPGDIISIKLGDIIPADARLLEGDPLKIDQVKET